MIRQTAIAASVVVAAGLGAAWYFGLSDGDLSQCAAGQVAGGDIGGPFELVNTDGATVTETDVIKGPSLVYFGYTYCPDVCPFDMARNADAVDLLTGRGYDVTPVFVTIDPKRDTPEVLSDYALNLHDKLIALTGSADQIEQAAATYKAYYKSLDDGSDDYLVDHSTFTYLMLPEHGFAEFYRRDASAEQMADSVACFIENS